MKLTKRAKLMQQKTNPGVPPAQACGQPAEAAEEANRAAEAKGEPSNDCGLGLGLCIDNTVSGFGPGLNQDRNVCGVPEAHFLECVEHVVTVLCGTFAFGYYSVEDIRQEIRVFCLEAMPRFDRSRDLKKFLYVHAYRRLINLQRNKLQRNDPPCIRCHTGNSCQAEEANQVENSEDEQGESVGFFLHTHESPNSAVSGFGGEAPVCQRYMDWLKRNASKKSLAQPAAYSDAVTSRHADDSIDDPLGNMANEEIWSMLDQGIPLHLRLAYLKLKEGATVPKPLKDQVLAAARRILGKKFPELSQLTELQGPTDEQV